MTDRRRIHITGASGAGTTTLAAGLSDRLSIEAFDTDDFFWRPTDPPYRERRPIADRIALMREAFLDAPDWILSGSIGSWGMPVADRMTHVIFLTARATTRLARLRRRERARYGDRIAPGGDLEFMHRGFLEWAVSYDEPNVAGRSRAAHEQWLASLTIPVIRLDGEMPRDQLTVRAIAALDGPGPA